MSSDIPFGFSRALNGAQIAARLTGNALVLRDGDLTIVNTADATKVLTFTLAGNTTGKTLTIATQQTTNQQLIAPNITATDTLATLGLAQTFSGVKTFSTPIASTSGGTGIANAGTFTNPANSAITGGGTLALGGFTLTVPATGTAGLLGTIQTWSAANTFSSLITASVGLTSTNGVITSSATGNQPGSFTANATTAGMQCGLTLQDAGTNKWAFYKDTANGFRVFDFANSLDQLVFAAGSVSTAFLKITPSTPSTSPTTGALQVIGGIGAGGASSLGTIGTSFTGNIIAGVQTAAAAVSGQVGEVISAALTTYSAAPATGSFGNATSVTLTPGDWDLSGFVTLSANGATFTATANTIVGISTTSASVAGTTEGAGDIGYISQVLNATSGRDSVVVRKPVNISTTTTYFLTVQSTYTAGTPQFVGGLVARRIR